MLSKEVRQQTQPELERYEELTIIRLVLVNNGYCKAATIKIIKQSINI